MEKENTIADYQTVLMELWMVWASICDRNDIRYQLYAGSALSAVRYNGIIPRDDDFDVVMLREDYNRFIDIAGSEIDKKKYFLQWELTEHWPMFLLNREKTPSPVLNGIFQRIGKHIWESILIFSRVTIFLTIRLKEKYSL